MRALKVPERDVLVQLVIINTGLLKSNLVLSVILDCIVIPINHHPSVFYIHRAKQNQRVIFLINQDVSGRYHPKESRCRS